MKFSVLLEHLSGVDGAPRSLAVDPDLTGAAAIDEAVAGQLAFLEQGSSLRNALDHCQASALLLPPDKDLQTLASSRGMAWIALRDPRLGFAEALEVLLPPRPRPQGIHPTAVIDPTAVLGQNVSIGAHAVVGAACRIGDGCVLAPGVVLYDDVEMGDGCVIEANAVLHPGSRLGRACVIHSTAVVGSEGFGFVPTSTGWRKMPQTGLVLLGEGVEVGCGSAIDRPSVGATRIGDGTKIDNMVHVGHGVTIGRGCALAAQVGIAGGAVLGNGVILAGQVGVANRARIGDRAIASSKSGIHGEVAAGEVVSGYPAIPNRLWLRCSAAFSRLPEMARTLRRLGLDEAAR
ncbi:MAG: UDP-3-O-(3-hydroxymyristoyl)glucosamine N-acyltransferase [Synechococcus sp.]